jgi:hypothetical protein
LILCVVGSRGDVVVWLASFADLFEDGVSGLVLPADEGRAVRPEDIDDEPLATRIYVGVVGRVSRFVGFG